MGTIFEPTLSSSSAFRASSSTTSTANHNHSHNHNHHNSNEPPSMADTLPSIAFGFDELRERMSKFTTRFDAFIATGRKRVLEERNAFKLNVAELQEDRTLKGRGIEILQQKLAQHGSLVGKEGAEKAEMQAALGEVRAQHAARQAARDALARQIAAARAEIAAREQAQRAHAERLAGLARFNSPELEFWVEVLCLRIEGAGRDDRLRFVFDHVDEREWGREVWFELCTERREYEVVEWRPRVKGEAGRGGSGSGSGKGGDGGVTEEDVRTVLERLNETRDLGGFLKGMRALFVEALRRG